MASAGIPIFVKNENVLERIYHQVWWKHFSAEYKMSYFQKLQFGSQYVYDTTADEGCGSAAEDLFLDILSN